MRKDGIRAAAAVAAFLALVPVPVAGQHEHERPAADTTTQPGHAMWSIVFGGGWRLSGMAQAFPIVTIGAPFEDGPLRETAAYLTQPVIMSTLASPGSRFALRLTPNFEGITQDDGELTFGAWGEGFIDKRHPHTFLHELVLSVNAWDLWGGAGSLSVGKGFAAFGTDDPMSRPAVKYPTNHHLSQVLERWMVTGAFLRSGWSLEVSVFGGNEPEDPWDFSNITPFLNSWSVRSARRWGGGWGPLAVWEASVSYADVREKHHDLAERTRLWNAAVRHDSEPVYALIEASLGEPDDNDRWYSVLGEASLMRGRHQPYARLELATRPEWDRLGPGGTEGFFRYSIDTEPIAATGWFIATGGYGYEATRYPFSVRPFIELQYFKVRSHRGDVDPRVLFGRTVFTSVSLGARVFIGGEPMRMGAYGVLDPMTAMHRPGTEGPAADHGERHDPQ